MKKALALLALTIGLTSAQAKTTEVASTSNEASALMLPRQNSFSRWWCEFRGKQGNTYDAALAMDNGYGGMSYPLGNDRVRRTVRGTKYNARTRQMTINVYELDSDKYIGRYVGTLSGTDSNCRYKGKFTNYKGVSISFDLRGSIRYGNYMGDEFYYIWWY